MLNNNLKFTFNSKKNYGKLGQHRFTDIKTLAGKLQYQHKRACRETFSDGYASLRAHQKIGTPWLHHEIRGFVGQEKIESRDDCFLKCSTQRTRQKCGEQFCERHRCTSRNHRMLQHCGRL